MTMKMDMTQEMDSIVKFVMMVMLWIQILKYGILKMVSGLMVVKKVLQ